jgi:penicillin-binding protein 1A
MFHAGMKNVVEFANSLGVESKLPAVPSLVLGTADISLKEMVTAYSSIANGGRKPDLYSISRITDSKGNVLYEREMPDIEEEEIEAPYHMIKDIMKNVTAEGTGARIYNYNIPFDVAGKTGTTQNQTDGWFIGATDDYVFGAWVGAQNRGIHFRNLGTGSGGRTALPLVGRMFEYIASTGYSPEIPLIDTFNISCPDSISTEEYAFLEENPGQFARIEKARGKDKLDILDILFGEEDLGEVITGEPRKTTPNRRTRQPSRPRSSSKSDTELQKFKKQMEKSLNKLLKKKKNKKRRRRN